MNRQIPPSLQPHSLEHSECVSPQVLNRCQVLIDCKPSTGPWQWSANLAAYRAEDSVCVGEGFDPSASLD